MLIAFSAILIFGLCQGALSEQNATQSPVEQNVTHSLPEQNVTQNESGLAFLSSQPELNDSELEAVLSDFEEYAEKGMNDWQVPGMAVAIVHGNDTIYMHAFGVKNVSANDSVTNNTIFQIGSTSKAFTAALVAMQVDEGNIGWDDRVIDHLPEFEMYDPWVTREFTVTDLMAQRSGLPPYSADTLSIMGYNRSYIRHAVRYIKPVTSLRYAYAYQNHLFLWAALLVEKETGKSWEDNVHDRIFQPLGMNNSTTGAEPFSQAEDVASLHVMENGTVRPLPMDWKYIGWVYTYGPAGGINSNIIDMDKWLRLQMNNGAFEGKRLINESSVRYMHSPKIAISPIASQFPNYYCQGWIYQEYRPYPFVWHNGGTSGHHTMIAFMPDANLGIIVLSNAGYTELPEALAFKFFDMYNRNPESDWSTVFLTRSNEAQNLTNATKPERPEPPSPPLPLENYTGNYSNEIYGQINITANGNGLLATAGPIEMQIILTPWNRDIFSASIPDLENEAGLASFSIGPLGRAESVTLGILDGVEFNRV